MVKIRAILLGCFLWGALGYAAEKPTVPLKEVHIQGLQRIDAATVQSYIVFPKDRTTFAQGDVDDLVQRLFSTHLFSRVDIRVDQGILRIQVQENPMISRITFENYGTLDRALLEKSIGLKTREVFTSHKVHEATKKLRMMYQAQGYMGVNVVPKIIHRPENRVDLIFEIRVGGQGRVSTILFRGNTAIASGTLKGVISTKEKGLFSFFTSDDLYDRERMHYDADLLRQFYLNQGFLDVVIHPAIAEVHKSFVYITHTIEEGKPYTLANIRWKKPSDVALAKVLGHQASQALRRGQRASVKQIQDCAEDLTKYLQRAGHPFKIVTSDIQEHAATHTADVVFEVKDIPKRYIHRTTIHGNYTTKDEVLRRELTFAEGDPINPQTFERSKERLEVLDFFSHVEVKPGEDDVEDGKQAVVVNVKEKSTGFFRIGGGYSTHSGPLARASFKEKNFRGWGQEIYAETAIARREKDLTLGWSEPYFLQRRLTANVELFISDYRADTRKNFGSGGYKNLSHGIETSLSYEPKDYWIHTVGYRIKEEKITPGKSADISPFLRESKGRKLISTVFQGIVYDRRNRIHHPSAGHMIGARQEWAGLGGHVGYLRHSVEAAYYLPLDEKKRWSLSLKVFGALLTKAGKKLRFQDRLNLGGSSLYGFDETGLGPRDRISKDALGGKELLKFTPQLNIPLLRDSMACVLSLGVNFGTVGRTGIEKSHPEYHRIASDKHKLRSAAFVSVSWHSPMGMLGFVFSKPMRREKNLDKTSHFYIALGSME